MISPNCSSKVLRIHPFQGLRPAPDIVHHVASVPYDVVSTDEARKLATDNPLSLLHVIRPEIDHPEGTDPYTQPVYATAKANFERLQRDGHLIPESEPCLYVYQQKVGKHSQRGVAAVCSIDDYEKGVIKIHEKTRKPKEDDRTRLTHALGAHPGPVFLTYRDRDDINTLVNIVAQQKPLYSFTASDGVAHTVWRVPGGDTLVKAFTSVPTAYVADGHHRSASAVRVGRERRRSNPHHTGDEPYNNFLCVLFPASQLNILPYNRVVCDLNGLTPESFIQKLNALLGPLVENAPPAPQRPHTASMYIGRKWWGIPLEPDVSEPLVDQLDVSLLQNRVLAPILGIDDPRTNDRIEFVGGIHGPEALVKRVDQEGSAAAFSLHPLPIEALMRIADAGQILPPKSTWFEPKLRSGLFIHTF